MRALLPLLALTACASDDGILYGGGWVSMTVVRRGQAIYEREWETPDRTTLRGHVRWGETPQAFGFDQHGRKDGFVQVYSGVERIGAEEVGMPCEDLRLLTLDLRMGPDYLGERPWMEARVQGKSVVAAPLQVMTGNLISGEAHGELIWLHDFVDEWPQKCRVEARPVPVWVLLEWELDPDESVRGPRPYPRLRQKWRNALDQLD